LFAGADFTALEEKIGTILSKDPERKKIYTQGYDGHSVRAYAYFPEDMPKITTALAKTTTLSDRVNIINSIAKLYPELRTKSKAPTFALQYLGTAYTLHKRTGFPMKQAIQIEKAFHSLYAESDKFNNKNKVFMEKHGYVNCAFGLQLRTPIVAQCVLDNSKTPYEAQAEVRSANNAITQSWGMLLNRAIIATNTRIEEAGYGEHILPINMIHDAAYFMLKDEPKYIKFLNDVLIEEMEWQEHLAIASNDIRITAEMEIGKSWADLKPLQNNATLVEIKKIIYG
jgi:DNA polymerase-1